MLPLFTHSFSRSRGAILGWGLSLALLGAYLMTFYDTLAKEQQMLQELVKNYPPEMMAFFGDMTKMFTPSGYLTVEFFSYMPLILGIFAVLAGSGLVVSDEENGTLDLLLAHPVSRTTFFAGRLLALLAILFGILGVAWGGLAFGLHWSTIALTWSDLLRPFISLFGVLSFFGSFALALSLLLPSRRLAATTAGLLLVASFFVTSLARVNADLETLAKFSPLNYYQSGDAIAGLKAEWLGGLLACTALFTLIAWWRFQRRDIRVAGEGSWNWALPWRKPKAA
jgi:ABC-2 type transport system permease protein